MVNPIPENIKDILSQLNPQQQVALRAYIASLRSDIKDLEAETLAKIDPDPHAHYHGHDKCTADHSHENKHHEEEHTHIPEAKHEEHDHDHHKGHEHKEHKHDHECEHKDHHDHGHHHEHEHPKHEEAPAWKKKAMEKGNDPHAAPFGGEWHSESNVSASDKMDE